jgi:ubiquinone/menaquinone biosynthesis C-methylase UbiE
MATLFLDPKKILNQLKLRSNMTAADFGSGSGGWAIPLAKKLEKGKVYAIDILEEPLSALRSKAQLEKVWNIETIKSDAEETSKLLKDSCDLVLMTNLLFEAKDKEKVLTEGKKVLKKGGKILIVDWKKEAPFGPQKDRVLPEDIKKMAKKLNLKVEKEFTAGLYHWALILLK